jgi:hypothetical protein
MYGKEDIHFKYSISERPKMPPKKAAAKGAKKGKGGKKSGSSKGPTIIGMIFSL